MKKIEFIHLIKDSLVDLKRNKARTFLTSLGITIGILSVLMLVAVGIGLQNYLKQQFESLGSNLILILPGSGLSGGGGNFGSGLIGGAKFDEKDLKNLEKINEAAYVVPASVTTSKFQATGKDEVGSVNGTNEQVFTALNIKPAAGEKFTKADVTRKAKVAFLGITIAKKLFGTAQNAVGKNVRIDNQRFRVIGVAEKKGDNDVDNAAMIPYKTAFGNLNPSETFFTFYLGANTETNIEVVKNKAKDILLKRYDEEDFSVTEQSEILSTFNQIFGIVNIVLVAIGSISLLVGGIGIMNIMYATVTERIKEVGIRRAIGATHTDILLQFLTEAVLLSLLGGIIGLTLAVVIVIIVQNFFPVGLTFFSVIVTLAISSGIGIFFGVFPARGASKLPPIEAIRYE